MARAETGQAPDLKSYLTGFALAGVLTAVPFCLVAWGLLPRQAALLVIAVAALLQVGVHLRFFLHLGRSTAPRENLLALAFAAVLVGLMVGGSLWIMFDLDQRHGM